MKVFASCSSYLLGQLMGPERACELVNEAVKDSAKRPPCFAVKALRELWRLSEMTLNVDGGASHLGKLRSRQFFMALSSDCDVWVSIDDDVTATRETLAWMLAAVDDVQTPRVCIAPCVMRGDGLVNVEWSPIYSERRVNGGGTVRRARAGGFGLVAVNRAALVRAASAAPSWRDSLDGLVKPAPFLDMLAESGEWTGEDVSFFRRLPRDVEVEALTAGKTMHAGHELGLEVLQS